jgi:hypothetical protein
MNSSNIKKKLIEPEPVYKKENGIFYNSYYSLRKNLPIFILSNLFIILLWIFFGKHTVVDLSHLYFTFIIVSLNAYLIHRYAEITGFSFLHKYHHDNNINKYWYAFFIETLINIIFAGGIYLLILNYLSKTVILKPIPVLIWAIYYTSVHMYTYHTYNVQTHKIHHSNQYYNFGPDLADILYDTKYEGDEFEDLNITMPNIVIIFLITFLILFNFKKARDCF